MLRFDRASSSSPFSGLAGTRRSGGRNSRGASYSISIGNMPLACKSNGRDYVRHLVSNLRNKARSCQVS
jgi:hypothetical protein